MSTIGLIETCLTYPLFAGGMIFPGDSMYAGVEKTLSNLMDCRNF
jgi:hypothetical protein